MDKEIKDQLDELGTNVKSFTEKAAKVEAVEGEVKNVKETVSKIEGEVKTIGDNVKVIKDAADKNQEAVDKLIADQQKFRLNERIDKDSFKGALETELKAKAADLKGYKDNRSPIIVNLKSVGDIGSGNFTTSGTQTFAGPTMLPGVQRAAFQQQHMRNILGTTSVNTDSVAVIRGARGEGGPTGVAAGGLKPQSDADWSKVIIPITKIAHHYDIPEEWLEDVSWLTDDITTTGIEELMVVEDNKIISNVTSGEFGGLVQNSTAFAAPSGLATAIDAPNNYDVLVAAMTQLKNANRVPNFIVTDHDSMAKMILTKASTGEYVFGAPNIALPNVFGVPLYGMNNSALADKFIVGDSNQAVVAVRKGISVRFYDQHASNAIYNMVTVVIEERIALVVKRTDAFIYGDLSDASDALATA